MNFEIATDTDATGFSVFVFHEPSDTLTIDPNVLVSCQDPGLAAITSQENGNSIFNKGQIWELDTAPYEFDDAVQFLNDNAFIYNAFGAYIRGSYNGVRFRGSDSSVENFGKIDGLGNFGVEFDAKATNNTLDNFGHIDGVTGAVAISAGDKIYNAGVLQSGVQGDGILVASHFPEGSALIVNAAHGLIYGSLHGIRALGAISLNNFGEVIGAIDCHLVTGRDIIVNHGTIASDVLLGHGNDYFNGSEGTSGQIYAGTGNAEIIAGKGGVSIHAGTGHNTLTGGSGADKFIFDSAVTGQVDKIINFTIGTDTIVLSGTRFAAIAGVTPGGLAPAYFHVGSQAETVSQHIIYDDTNGFLSYDADGSGSSAAMHFATIASNLQLTAADFFVAA